MKNANEERENTSVYYDEFKDIVCSHYRSDWMYKLKIFMFELKKIENKKKKQTKLTVTVNLQFEKKNKTAKLNK